MNDSNANTWGSLDFSYKKFKVIPINLKYKIYRTDFSSYEDQEILIDNIKNFANIFFLEYLDKISTNKHYYNYYKHYSFCWKGLHININPEVIVKPMHYIRNGNTFYVFNDEDAPNFIEELSKEINKLKKLLIFV